MARPLLLMERADETREPDGDVFEALRGGWREDWGGLHDATARVYAPAFYEDVLLVEVDPAGASPPLARLYFLYHDGAAFRLNGTSPPIHEVNARSRPWLREDSVLDYLAFFCFFVRGEQGPYLIVDQPDGRYVPDIPDGEGLHAAFRPPRIWGQDENGDWRVSALVYYANALFIADFLVNLGGMIEMKRDQPLLVDLPNRVDAPLDVLRRDS